eukprot:Filipodium_phascolosomae@DN2011_c0_g1_i1.p1
MERLLLTASRQGQMPEIKNLVEKSGISTNVRDSAQWTPIMCAAYNGHIDIVSYLVDKNANVHAENQFKWTALHLAASRNHIDVVRLLIAAGANVNAADQDGHTALHAAASNPHTNVVRELLNAGADSASVNKHGETARDIASEFDILDVVDVIDSHDSLAKPSTPVAIPAYADRQNFMNYKATFDLEDGAWYEPCLLYSYADGSWTCSRVFLQCKKDVLPSNLLQRSSRCKCCLRTYPTRAISSCCVWRIS